MAHQLYLKVTAEGVETEDQLKLLRKLKCDQVQGFHLSKPLPAEDVLPLLRASHPSAAR
jgi:EAL domain-containing protein (putative c-di-GMP-specific phosphodiesterase class I)